MQRVSESARGLGLILRLNGDTILNFAALGLALFGATALGGLAMPALTHGPGAF
jgi:hypothetical protein